MAIHGFQHFHNNYEHHSQKYQFLHMLGTEAYVVFLCYNTAKGRNNTAKGTIILSCLWI